MNEKVVVHVGLHRTGTTFLQQKIFPLLETEYRIISNESLSGNPIDNSTVFNRVELLHCIKNLYPDARILLVKRDLDSWKKSCW